MTPALAHPIASPPALVVRDDVDAAAWDAYVAAQPHASGYHQAAWRGVISKAFGHDTCYLAALENDRVVGVLPLVLFRSRLFGRFAVSLPFLNYGGVVADSVAAREALVAAAIARTQDAGARSLELRHEARLCPALRPKAHKVAMRLPLASSEEAQWAALDRKVRNQVRKADKSGLAATSGGMELVDGFYDVFARNMRDLGTPVYAKRFFEEVLRTFPDSARVYVVRHDDCIAAASITCRWRHRIEVPWASALREYNPLSANVRLYWEMIRGAIAGGATEFDFGRSTPDEGTFHFKKQWGAAPHPLVWEYWLPEGAPLPDLSPKNAKFQAAIAGWRRLPVPVTRWLGPRIVRNIP